MKKLTTLVLAAGLVVSSFAGAASAAEFKPFAQFAEEFVYGDGGTEAYSVLGGEENFNAATRIRFGFDYIASEDLSATMLFQYRHNWGQNATEKGGFSFTADEAIVQSGDQFRMRLAYIDWTIPSTDVKVRMGRHALVTPSYAFGSAILDGRGDGITISGAVNDNISLGLSWVRLASGVFTDWTTGWSQGHGAEDDSDAVLLQAEFAYDGWKVAPWAMYAGKQAGARDGAAFTNVKDGYAADAWVIGVSGELNMFDPFVFAVDALYANTSAAYYDLTDEDNLDGFYVGAKASYKFSNGTAAIGGWYATGNDSDNDNSFVLLDGGFSASTILYGDNIIGADSYNTLTDDSPFNTWGLIAEYANFSFLQDLSHTVRVVYVQGTNDKAAAAGTRDFLDWTEDDSAVEVDFNSTYQIYKNFAATLELGYVFIDQSNIGAGEEQDDIFRSALTFVYNF